MIWRRNVASLSKTELLRFTTAVNALKNNGAQGNKYDEFVLWHHAAANKDTPENQVTPPNVPHRAVAHTGPSFFPWHRYFIRRFELELQKVVNGTGITLPYWNWTEDSSKQQPLDMAVWNVDCMGGNGEGKDHIVDTGPFRSWPIVRLEVGEPKPWESPDNKLTRDLGGSGFPLPTSAEVSNASKDITSYDTSPWNDDSKKSFRKALEEVHGHIHLWIGGSMFPMTSPNDPVFFLHHCYVDRIWDRWQINKPDNDDYYPSDGTVTTGVGVIPYQNRSARIFPWDEERNPPTLSSVLSSQQMGVAYDPGNHAITTVATGSGNLEVYWIGSNGSVNCRWYDQKDQNWRDPYRIAVPGSASVPNGSITAIYDQDQRHVWWTRPDSSVGHWVGGYDKAWKWGENTIPSTVKYSSTSGGIAALFIRNAPQMFCIGCDSQVYREYWDGRNWRSEALPSMKWCSTSSGLAVVPNGPTAVDVLWIEGDGSVKGQWFHDGGSFGSNTYGNPYEIAGPGSAWGNSIVAVSRDIGKIDVWWIGPTESGQRAARPNTQNGYVYWNSSADSQWKGARAINTGGSIRGGMAAVVSSPTSMEVYWIYNGGRYGMTWNSSEGWGGTYTLYGPPASTSGGLAASMRTSNEIDVLWIGPDNDNSVVGTNINYQRGQWPQSNQTRFDALPRETPSFQDYAASTGLPSDGGI